jgi:hypothetical protein
MLPSLAELGFQVAESRSSNRGSCVRLSNAYAWIEVTADWLEGEIDICAARIGEPSLELEQLVDLRGSRGLHLRRLSRSVRTAVVADQLEQAASLLVEHQRPLLAGD